MPSFSIPKPWRNASHKNPHNPLLNTEKVKKQTILYDVQQGPGSKTIDTKAGTVKFVDGIAVLPDDGRGDEIAAEVKEKHSLHPTQYGVVKHREGMKRDSIHNYTFGRHPGVPWGRYDERGRRLPDG